MKQLYEFILCESTSQAFTGYSDEVMTTPQY